jgi:hypothetical protein
MNPKSFGGAIPSGIALGVACGQQQREQLQTVRGSNSAGEIRSLFDTASKCLAEVEDAFADFQARVGAVLSPEPPEAACNPTGSAACSQVGQETAIVIQRLINLRERINTATSRVCL